MITSIEKLLSSLREHQCNKNLYNTKKITEEIAVFLHTSVVTCNDCVNIKKHIISYQQVGYSFKITDEVLNEIKYLAENKKSLFRKNAKALYKAYRHGYISLTNYDNNQLRQKAILCPSLPFAYRFRYNSPIHFKYIVSLSDHNKIAVIVDGDTQVSNWLFSSKGSVENTSITPIDKYVTYDNHKVKLSNKNLMFNGGEAALYKHRNKLIKVYHNGNMTDVKVAKIKQLMSYGKLNKKLKRVICLPTSIVTTIRGNPCGVVVPRLKKHKSFTHLLAKGMSARKCKKTLKLYLLRIFELNLLSIIVSDINQSNIMCRKNDIVLVDTDSFQVGCFPSGCYRQDLLTKPLYDNLKHIDSYIRDIKSDIISFASVVFTLLVGAKPTRYKNSSDSSNFVTHPFLYRNTLRFYNSNIIDEALKNWNKNISDCQKDFFIDVFRDNKYISYASIDKCLFG